jgi:hypothetical protein
VHKKKSRIKINISEKIQICIKVKESGYQLVISKTRRKLFRYRFGNETKTLCLCSQISLIGNRLFRFGPESALLGQIERISFGKTNSGTNSIVIYFIPIRYRNICQTFVERFWNIYGTFVEYLQRLWNICSFTVLTLLLPALFFSVAVLYTCSQGVKYCICTLCQLFSQNYVCIFVSSSTYPLMFSCAVLRASSLECRVAIFILHPI